MVRCPARRLATWTSAAVIEGEYASEPPLAPGQLPHPARRRRYASMAEVMRLLHVAGNVRNLYAAFFLGEVELITGPIGLAVMGSPRAPLSAGEVAAVVARLNAMPAAERQQLRISLFSDASQQEIERLLTQRGANVLAVWGRGQRGRDPADAAPAAGEAESLRAAQGWSAAHPDSRQRRSIVWNRQPGSIEGSPRSQAELTGQAVLDLLAGGGRAAVAARADLDVEDLVREVRRELGGPALAGAGRSASDEEVLAAYGQLAACERAGPLRAVGVRIAWRLVGGGPVGLPGGGPKKQPHNWTAPPPPSDAITRPGERGRRVRPARTWTDSPPRPGRQA